MRYPLKIELTMPCLRLTMHNGLPGTAIKLSESGYAWVGSSSVRNERHLSD
jgi:hypothetical protein